VHTYRRLLATPPPPINPIGYVTGQIGNLVGLPLALAPLAAIPFQISWALARQTGVYLQVAAALAAGDQALANKLIESR
jgi:hypothetical protein